MLINLLINSYILVTKLFICYIDIVWRREKLLLKGQKL